ncbi:MAG: TonB-dependent receptor, partial [Pseudomonadota bacterium]
DQERAVFDGVELGLPLLVGTSRPETKLGDTAVAVHPDDERFQEHIGKVYEVQWPKGPKISVRVVADEEVDPETGTGALGVTPAHSAVDFEIAQRHDLPLVQVIGEDGRMTEAAGEHYAGMTVEECRDAFAAELDAAGLLVEVKDYQQQTSICYRSKKPIEPLPKPQWFIAVDKPAVPWKGRKLSLKQVLRDVVASGDIQILPDHQEKTYFHWIDNLRDWCISRQIWWGHRVPVYYRGEEDMYVGHEPPAGDGWAQDEDGGFAYNSFGSENLNCFLPDLDGSTFFGIPLSDNRSRGYFCGEIEFPEGTQSWNTDELDLLGVKSVERTTWRASLISNYEAPSGHVLTLTTAYNRQSNLNVFDNTLEPSDTPNFSINRTRIEDFAQEIRFASPVDDPFRWTVGGYYYSEHDGIGWNASGDFDPAGGSNIPSAFDSGDKVRNLAGFGMLEYDITDRLTATVEGRYQQDKITETDEVFGAEGTSEIPDPVNKRTTSFDAFLPRFTLSYEVKDNMNLYANVAKGNKAGGFNSFPDASEFFDPMELDEFNANFATFDEETVWSYEIGAKGSKYDGRLNYGIALYYLDWTSQQLTQSQPYRTSATAGTTVPFIVNAGASEVFGMELELFGNLTDWFDYRLGYSYTDAEFTDFYDENTEELLDTDGLPSSDPMDVDGPNGQVAGNDLPQTPKHQLTASGTFRHELNSNVELFFRTDYNYESNRWVQVHNLAGTGDSHNLNLRLGADIGDVTVSLFYNNVLDDDTPLVVTRLLDFDRILTFAPNCGWRAPDTVKSRKNVNLLFGRTTKLRT